MIVPPSGEYLMALSRRLRTRVRSAISSPRTGASAGRSRMISWFFATASGSTSVATSAASRDMSTGPNSARVPMSGSSSRESVKRSLVSTFRRSISEASLSTNFWASSVRFSRFSVSSNSGRKSLIQ